MCYVKNFAHIFVQEVEIVRFCCSGCFSTVSCFKIKACFKKKRKKDRRSLNSTATSKVMPKTLIRNQERTLELSEKKAFLQGERWLKANNNNSVTGKIYTFSCAERERDCAAHTAGNRLQMKANLVSLCNWELQLDHRSPWNKDGGRRAREAKRRRAREGARCERKGGGRVRKKKKQGVLAHLGKQ